MEAFSLIALVHPSPRSEFLKILVVVFMSVFYRYSIVKKVMPNTGFCGWLGSCNFCTWVDCALANRALRVLRILTRRTQVKSPYPSPTVLCFTAISCSARWCIVIWCPADGRRCVALDCHLMFGRFIAGGDRSA